MESYFTSDFFAGNRQRLRELFTGTAPIIVTANGLLQRGGDSIFPFAQDASFWYLTGLDEPDITLVIDRDKEYLIVPARSSSREAFDGVVAGDALSIRSGITEVYDDKAGWELLGARLRKVKHAATIAVPPAYIKTYGLYTNPARAALVERIKTENPKLELLDLGPHLIRLRMLKQPQEIRALQKAIDITIAGIKETFTPGKLRRYTHEYQIEAQLSQSFRKRGASGHAFPPIVASGPRACTLHYVENSGAVASGELVVADVGAEVEHYAADITRTIAIGKPNRRQQSVHSAVLEVQQFALDMLGPDVMLKDYEQKVEHFMGEKLRELGLIKTINHKNVRRFFPHAASHFLGLNVHDIGDYNRPLEAGMVITVEPGIYIPEEAIGVRIEDDVLITKKGLKILSGKLPRELAQ
jgi:Xaa-Pro aminopeptidase